MTLFWTYQASLISIKYAHLLANGVGKACFYRVFLKMCILEIRFVCIMKDPMDKSALLDHLLQYVTDNKREKKDARGP
jgi:hypothetical protein